MDWNFFQFHLSKNTNRQIIIKLIKEIWLWFFFTKEEQTLCNALITSQTNTHKPSESYPYIVIHMFWYKRNYLIIVEIFFVYFIRFLNKKYWEKILNWGIFWTILKLAEKSFDKHKITWQLFWQDDENIRTTKRTIVRM